MAKGQLGSVLRYIHRIAAATGREATDRELLARFGGAGDEQAFAALVERHGRLVLGVCRRILHDVEDAEDAFQATFLVLARKARSVRWQDSVSNWLYETACRLASEIKVKSARRRAREREAGAMAKRDATAAEVRRELASVLDEELQKLPARLRTPLLLCYFEEQTRDEAARRLGWSLRTLQRRLEQGRQRLRTRLLRRGWALPASLLATELAQQAANAAMSAARIKTLAQSAMAYSVARALSPADIRPGALRLAEGLLRRTAFQTMTALVLAAALAGSVAGLLAYSGLVADTPPAQTDTRTAASNDDHQPKPERDEISRVELYGDPLPPGAIARLGTVRFRAPHEALALAFAPDGNTIAVASYSGLFLFDAVSGKRLKRLAAYDSSWQEQSPYVLSFSADGKRLAARGVTLVPNGKDGETKRVVRVWDLAGKGKPREYDAEHLVWLGWSPHNAPLAVCLESGAMRLHELAAGRSRRFECKDLRKPGLTVLCDCSPAGGALAAVDEQGTIHVWDTVTGKERTLRPENPRLAGLALSPDGRHLASLNHDPSGRAAVQLWDVTSGKALYAVAADQEYLMTVVFAPHGKTLATAGWRGIRFWDVATGRERSRSQGEGSETEKIAFSGDARTLATLVRHGGTVHLWDVATGMRKPEPLGHTCRPYGTSFSPDGRRLATGGGLDGTIHIWDLTTARSLVRIHRNQWVRDIAFSADGRSLYSTWLDDNLWISDADSGERQHVIKLEDPERPDTRQSAISMRLSADGKKLVAFSYYYPKKNGAGRRYQETLITAWDPITRKQLFRRRLPGMDSRGVLSPDARLLAMPYPHDQKRLVEAQLMGAPVTQHIRLENLATGELMLTFPAFEGQTLPLAFSPDGRLLAANHFSSKRRQDGAQEITLRLWEVATTRELLSLPSATQYRAAFSVDGRLLALTTPPPKRPPRTFTEAPDTQEILIYDLVAGRDLQRFKGFDAEVNWLAFAPDGRHLISGMADSTLLIWNVERPSDPERGKLGADGWRRRGRTWPATMDYARSGHGGHWRPHRPKRFHSSAGACIRPRPATISACNNCSPTWKATVLPSGNRLEKHWRR